MEGPSGDADVMFGVAVVDVELKMICSGLTMLVDGQAGYKTTMYKY